MPIQPRHGLLRALLKAFCHLDLESQYVSVSSRGPQPQAQQKKKLKVGGLEHCVRMAALHHLENKLYKDECYYPVLYDKRLHIKTLQ